MRLTEIEKQLDDDNQIVRYLAKQSCENRLRQRPRESRIDELFQKLEKLLPDKMPM
jgi:hypothetical protein